MFLIDDIANGGILKEFIFHCVKYLEMKVMHVNLFFIIFAERYNTAFQSSSHSESLLQVLRRSPISNSMSS